MYSIGDENAVQLIEVLPKELIDYILSLLDIPSLFRLKEVCRFFYDLIIQDSFWQGYYKRLGPQQEERLGVNLLKYLTHIENGASIEIDEAVKQYLSLELSTSKYKNNDHMNGKATVSELMKEFLKNDHQKLQESPNYCEWYVRNLKTEDIFTHLLTNQKELISITLFTLDSRLSQNTVRLLFELKKIEHVFAALVAVDKLKTVNTQNFNFIYSKPLARLLSQKAIVAVLKQHTHILLRYKEILEKRNIYCSQLGMSEDSFYRQTHGWLKDFKESELVDLFATLPEIILLEPEFIQLVSNDTFLRVCLKAADRVNVKLFKHDFFVDRLLGFSNISLILRGLISGEIKYDHQQMVSASNSNDRTQYWLSGILSSERLVYQLSDRDLISFAEKTGYEIMSVVLESNAVLRERLALNRSLMRNFIAVRDAWLFKFAELFSKEPFSNSLICYELALMHCNAATLILNVLEIHFTQQQLHYIKLSYPNNKDIKEAIDFRLRREVNKYSALFEIIDNLSSIEALVKKYLEIDKDFVVPTWIPLKILNHLKLYSSDLENNKILELIRLLQLASHSNPLTEVMIAYLEDIIDKRNVVQESEKNTSKVEFEKTTSLDEIEEMKEELVLQKARAESEKRKKELRLAITNGQEPHHSSAVQDAKKYKEENKISEYRNLLIPICWGFVNRKNFEEANKWYESIENEKLIIPDDLRQGLQDLKKREEEARLREKKEHLAQERIRQEREQLHLKMKEALDEKERAKERLAEFIEMDVSLRSGLGLGFKYAVKLESVEFIIPICSGYLKQGNYAEAKKCYDRIEASSNTKENYENFYKMKLVAASENPSTFQMPIALDLIKWREKFPDEYQYLINEFQEKFLDTTNWLDTVAERFIEKAKELHDQYIDLMAQKQKVNEIIQKILAHTEEMNKRVQLYTANHDVRTASIYQNRVTALQSLKTDMQKAVDDYFNKDYSNPKNTRNDKALYSTLSQTVKSHLDKKESDLKNHAGSKPIIYGVLSGLGWILGSPYMIYKAVTSGHMMFQAQNTTEVFLSDEIGCAIAQSTKTLR